MLGIDSCTTALEVNIHKTIRRMNVHVTAVVCNLIVYHGFLPVIFMGQKNFKYLRSTELLYLKKVVGFANFAQPQLPI